MGGWGGGGLWVSEGVVCRVPTAQGKQGKCNMAKKKSLSGKTQGNWKFCQNTGIESYQNTICREISQFCLEDRMCLPSQFCI